MAHHGTALLGAGLPWGLVMSGHQGRVDDVLKVTRIAWDLYHRCFLVAKEARDSSRQLMNELDSYEPVCEYYEMMSTLIHQSSKG